MSKSSTTSPLVRVEREEDLLFVTLNDPDRANALSVPMIEQLTELYGRDLLADDVRAVVLSSTGKHFSAGADLEHLAALANAGGQENRRDSERLRRLFASVLGQDALTFALVQGSCVAGGCGLATAHDFVVAAEDSRFMYSEVRIGFVAALVATFLPLRVSGRHMRELLLDPQFVPAAKALEMGLVNHVVQSDALAETGRNLAIGILERSSSSSIALTKGLIRRTIGLPLDERLEQAAAVNAEARGTEDCKRGIATFLASKGTPRWR